jgi:oxygen-independent coproporphyrinogen-3 oxidase
VAAFTETIDPRLAMGETMMTGLRLLRTGVPDAHFAALHGVALREVFGATIERLAARGLIAWNAEMRCGSHRLGLMLGNQVFAEFLPDERLTAATCATARRTCAASCLNRSRRR